jgi:aspartate kinase
MSITCKFGGSSVADAACFRRVKEIVDANPERRFIVPSAPGKRTPDDKKVTDLLYAWHNLVQEDLDPAQPRGMIAARFEQLAAELGIEFDVHTLLEEIARDSAQYKTPDYMASRGEALNGHLIATFLGATYVEPADCILFDERGQLDPATYDKLAALLKGDGLFVVPGFYGATPEGKVKTFSRGGSDVTGAIVARATNSTLYENWTDVSGFLMADPRIVSNAKGIAEITYEELRELSYMGAQVLHDEAIFPVREPGIAINIRNTKEPDHPGTMIVPEREPTTAVVGIAGREGFAMINIAKALMNKQRGFGRRVLEVLEEQGVSFEHMPTGIDTISLIIKEEELDSKGPGILADLEKRCEPDRISLSANLAIIATVGQGMAGHVGVAAKLFTALSEAGVNIRVIDQGSSENNIIIGVEGDDLDKAVSAIYHAFCE